MRKSTRLLAIFLAVLMTVSVLPVSAFADEEVVSKTITAVDTTGLFMETVFPYNPGSGTAFWTAQVAYVENPTFYSTIPATVGGVRVDLPVTWECTTEYDGKAIGNTYTFEAVADEDYIWECDVPVITVEIVDAGWASSAARQSFAVADSAPVPYALKAHSDGKTYVYDITGCNELLPGHSGITSGLIAFAGGKNTSGTGKTFANPTIGEAVVSISDGVTLDSVYAGGHGVNHQGDSYIYFKDATVATLSAGARGTSCGVTGDAYFDISGNVAITTVTGKGHTGNALGGTMYVNIHDLANTSTIGNIVRSVAPKLVVDLDSTSTRLLSGGNITGVTTDGYTDNNVRVNINGEKFVGMVDETTVTGIPEIIIKDEASAVLPTTFGSLSGFTWEGDLETSGTKTIKLVAPNGYFFDGFAKKKNFTVTVYDELVEVSEVTIDQGDVTINEGNSKTLTATVEPDNALDRTVTWSTEDTGIISVDAVTGRVTALAVGVATVKATAGNVSDTCTVTVERAVSITDVDTEGLVLSTAFPYNDNANTSYWHTYVSNVTDPTFYPTLSVLVEGEATYTDVDVQWICNDENGNGVTYDSTAIGTTYYFEAMAEGYNFVNGAPVIEVKIVDAGMTLPATRIFGFSTTGDIIHTVVRDGEGETTGIYDATGYNLIAPFINEGNKTDLDFNFIAGVANKAGTGKTPATSVTGDTKMTLEGSTNLTRVAGGGYGITQTGNAYIYANDSSFVIRKDKVTGIYGGGYTGDLVGNTYVTVTGTSIIPNIYGGGASANVTGDTNIDISGKPIITNIYGGSYGSGKTVSGTAYLTIHDLEEDWSIEKISKGSANAMVIDVDDPEIAVEIFKAVDDWTNVTAKVNGETVTVVPSVNIGQTEYSVPHGTQLATLGLPTSFEAGGQVVGGFTWEGTYTPSRAGTYVLTLTAPEGVYLTVDVAVSITVERKIATKIINSVPAEPARASVDYKASLADAIAALPTEFVANDGTLTVTSVEWEATDGYKSAVPGEYTFTSILADEDFAYASGVEAYTAIVTVKAPATEGVVVTEIDLPVNYTVFTKDTGIVTLRDGAGNASTEIRPIKFYDKLDAVAYENGVRKEIQVTGIEWEGELSRTDVSGEYWIYTIKSYDNSVQIDPEIIADLTITAYHTNETYASNSGNIKANGTVIVPAVIKLSGYEAYSNGYKGYPGMAAMDATGFNNLYSNIGLPNTVYYYAGNYKDIVADVTLVIDEGVQTAGAYGGSYKASMTGDSVVTFKKNSTMLENVYAGSFQDFFKGTSTLNFEAGSAVKGTVYASSNEGSFDGDVIINVESGAKIAGIAVAPEGEDYPDSVTINVTSDFDLSVIEGLETGLVTVYVDGVQRHFISNVDFGSFRVEVENGAVSDYRDILPKVSVTTTANQTYEVPETDYTWTAVNGFDGNNSGEYVFTLKFNDNYSFINDAQYNNTLVIYVKVASADYKTVSEITTEIPTSVTVPDGTAIKDVEILSSVSAYTYGVGQTASDAVLGEINGITWISSDYNPNVEGNYTFTMVLPDGYVMATPVTVTVTVMAVEDPTITAIKVPVTETYFTKGVVTEPKFYSTLEADVLNSDTTTDTVTLRGLVWKCDTYNASTLGSYEFVIDPSVFDGKYQLKAGLLEETKITVHVVDATISHNTGYYRTTTTTILPIHCVQHSNGNTAFCDLTGCNMIFASTVSAAARVFGGGNYSKGSTPGQTAHLVMSSGTMGLLTAGSQGHEFTGNAIVDIYGNPNITDIVAGTTNETFNGNTTINIDGEAEINRIIAGSEYRTAATTSGTSGIIVGSPDKVAYNGVITINIKDTFAGSIGSIQKTSAGKLIINCSANFPYASYVDLADPTVEVYVDGQRAQHVTNVEAPEKAVYNVALGTAADAIGLPTTLKAMINGAQGTINGVTWTCDNYNADKAGKYTFTPVIPAEYSVTTDIVVTVRVLTATAGQSVITAFAPINTISVSLGTELKDIALPKTVSATANGQSVQVEVDNWACSNYDGTVFGAEYTFTATVSGEYGLSVEAPTVTVKVGSAKIVEIYVPVTETTFPRGAVETPVFYDTLTVKLDSGMVTEISGFEWTVKDYNKNSVGTYTATINAAPENCEFAASLNVPSIKVTVVRQQHDVMKLDSYVYLYGIPTVVDGTTSATYLYDMTGCNKLSQTNIAGKTIFAGTPKNTASLKTTMIEMRGGKLGSIYGGSRDSTRITESTYIYILGGSLSQVYAGGNGSTTSATMAVTKNTYVYIENASISSRVSASGYNGNVEEDATVIVKNSTLNGLYAGSYSKKIGNVEGTATIKLLDGAKVGTFYGAGRSPVVNELEVYLSKNAAITSKFDVMGQSNVTGTAKIFFETGFDLSKVYTEEEQVKLYEGHFLEDRETFVTDREVKVIRNGGFVRGDFYVTTGTSLENIGLPTTVNGEVDGNPETISGISYSPVGDYDATTPGRYEFKLNIPDGYNVPPTTMKNAGKVTVVVTEPAESDYITAVFGEDTEYTFANGTAIENIGLPSAYNVVLSAGKQKTAPVKNWTVKDENGRTVTFDSYTAGTYVFTPNFDSAYKVLSSVELPTHTVTISAYRPYRDGNTRYLSGIPADIGSMIITDKNGNYLGQAGTWTIIYGGSSSADVESTDVTLNSGTLYGLYGGSAGRDVKGDIKVTVNGGTVPYLYAGSVQGTANNVELTINAGDITNAYGANNFTCYGSIKHTVNGGTITNYYVGDSNANGSVRGTAQAEDEVLALSTEKDKGPIVVKQGELISIEFVQNGGSIRALYGGGNGASTANGSVKMYLNRGTANIVSGTGAVAGSTTSGNTYIVMADGFVCDTIYANQPGTIFGKSYVVIPETFNRYNILGWYEEDDVTSDNPDLGGDVDEDDFLEDADVRAEVIVSGGYYEQGIPILMMYISSTQTVFARGVPIKIIGETAGGSTDEDDEWEDATIADLTTYVWYFDENYDEGTEVPETFSYETYVDKNGDPIVLTGVWRKYPEPLTAGATAVIYGGGMNGTSDIYPSTYVEYNSGQTKGVYGGGKNSTAGTANLVLNPTGPISPGSLYGAGNQDVNARANRVYIKVLGGSYSSIVAGGYKASSNDTQVDVLGGSVNNIYLGGYTSACVTAGEVKLNLSNCTVGNIYGGGYGDGSSTLGSAYINVNENVDITGYVYPKGVGKRPDGENSGPVTLWAHVNLNDTDKASAQLKKIKYTKSQAPYIYINGVALGEMPATSTATFEHADKKVEVTTAQASDYRGNRTQVFLNGIPTVIAGDGNGQSFAYQAKTKDGTLNAYQKNEDGTFKYDENGERISNIVRDPVTGMAVKGAKLVNTDLIDCIVYGGANGKSVEDVYVELHNGGGMWILYAGCRGGHVGYDEQGNEVGLLEVRQFDGGAFDETHIGSVLGKDPDGNATVNVLTSKTVFLGIGGGTKYISFGGTGGTIGSEEKFMDGYYNKAGEVISYTDPDDNQVYEITGAWEDYALDIKKEDYAEYYESSNAHFNGEDNTDFLESDYYVDPYDDHYSIYVLTAAYSTNHYYLGTTASQFDYAINRVYGNAYVRQSAYGLKYDAELDMFVEDYNSYMPMDTFFPGLYLGSNTGVRYNDIRVDWEAVPTVLRPLGNKDGGALNLGHTYMNLYETDTVSYQNNEVYNSITVKDDPRVTINRNFFPKWSFTVAWALGIDPEMVQIALDKGYVNGATEAKDVRISMITAEDAARLLNYYYAGSFDEFVTVENEEQSRGWQEVFDASGDIGKFTIRHFNMISPSGQGINRYLIYNNSRFGDGQLITFPNGETMLIDCGLAEPATLVKDIRHVLEQLEEQGYGDGKTIDYFLITHYHSDHYGNAPEILNAFDIKNFVLPPFDKNGVPASYVVTAQRMSERYVAEGKDPINFIRVQRDDKFTIGEGDTRVDLHITNPGDHSYRTYTLAEGIRRSENGGYGSFANPYSIAIKFTFKGQTYFTGADIREDAEVSMLRLYGKDFLKCDVMKLSHHGHATSNIWAFDNAINPDVTIQNAEGIQYARACVPKYFENNNTGGYDEDTFSTAVQGNIRVTLDGENVTSVTQWQVRAYERNGDEYKNSGAAYEALVGRVKDTRNALTVVADNATAPYGTAYIWNSYANYIDGQLEELSKRYYSGTMTLDMMADYTEKLLDLEDFIDDATMYGGTDTTPDVELPGTPGEDVGGNETTTPGASGGIIGDIGGGDAGAGIGGGAAPGGAAPVGPAGPSVDDGETTDPVTPDDNRRFIDVAETDWFNKAVNYVADNNYFQGVSKNEFDPYGKMTRAMLVTVIGRIAKADVSQAKSDFADVADGNWYAGYVAWAAENGIVTGVGEGKFAPNDNVTREQIAAILMRYAKYKGIDVSVDSTEKYDSMKDTADVSEYAVEALKWATANSVINGAEGNINPKGNATRAEVAQMIMNFCNTFSI